MSTLTLHRLRPVNKILKEFYVLDTETIKYHTDGKRFKYHLSGRPENFCFGVIYGHNFTKVIYSIDEFKKELLDPKYKDKYIFMHNAEYDLNVIYDNIYAMDSKAIFNGKFITASNGNAKFGDSLNIFRYSLAQIGEFLGKPKLDLNLNKLRSKILPEDINYCIRDCEIVYDALFQIFNEVGSIKITQASLSLTYFRRYHLAYNIKHQIYNENFRHSYYGGRTEVFKLGNTHASVYDINSSYPNAMVNCIFPNPNSGQVLYGASTNQLLNYINTTEGCCHIKIYHKPYWIGFLPYKKEGKLIFPVGKFEGWWNFNELRLALKYDIITILEIKEVVTCTPMKSPFTSYINSLYERRLETNSIMEKERIKIYMNSLYGKFAQHITEEMTYVADYNNDYNLIKDSIDNKTFKKLMLFNKDRDDCFLVTKKDTTRLSYSIPSIASYITSHARIQLLEKMIELKNNKVVYCDTDSIFIEIESNMIDSKQLGGWKKENKLVTKINGLKNYKFIKNDEEFRRLKGVPKSAIEFAPNKFKYVNLMKTKEALRRNLDAGKKTLRKKTIKNTYDKRIVHPDGTTKPIEL